MIILPAIALVAEFAALTWFALFLTLARQAEIEGRTQPQAPRDASARVFLGAVKLAFATAIGTLVVLTLLRIV